MVWMVRPHPPGNPGVVGRARAMGDGFEILALPSRVAAPEPSGFPGVHVRILLGGKAAAAPAPPGMANPNGGANRKRRLIGGHVESRRFCHVRMLESAWESVKHICEGIVASQ